MRIGRDGTFWQPCLIYRKSSIGIELPDKCASIVTKRFLVKIGHDPYEIFLSDGGGPFAEQGLLRIQCGRWRARYNQYRRYEQDRDKQLRKMICMHTRSLLSMVLNICKIPK